MIMDSGRPAGLVLAKCEDVDWLDEVDSIVTNEVMLSPLVESAVGVRGLDALCRHGRVQQCHLGEIDLLADLGARPAAAEELIAHARTELVYASAAAEILPPIGGVRTDIPNLRGLEVESLRLADLGFGGRPAVHPSQVPVINAAFTPSDDEVGDAQNLVDRYDAALRVGTGATADEDGSMLDEAVVRRARRFVERAQAYCNEDRSP
jgi:citrate lyase subunit beta/citryl-CoA lyase